MHRFFSIIRSNLYMIKTMIESSKLPLPLQGGNAVTGSISIGMLLNSLWSCRFSIESGSVTNRYSLLKADRIFLSVN